MALDMMYNFTFFIECTNCGAEVSEGRFGQGSGGDGQANVAAVLAHLSRGHDRSLFHRCKYTAHNNYTSIATS